MRFPTNSIETMKQMKNAAQRMVGELEQNPTVIWVRELTQLYAAVATLAETHLSTVETIESLAARVESLEDAAQQERERKAAEKPPLFKRILSRRHT